MTLPNFKAVSSKSVPTLPETGCWIGVGGLTNSVNTCTQEKTYRNQRDHWSDFYQNVIIVPIRSVDILKLGNKEKDASNDIGFLCVDTQSINRLNNTWHLELLAAFADQMYNFMSLMRGEYQLKAITPTTSVAQLEPPRSA